MSLLGECTDCGSVAPLRYKPSVPLDNQTRPSLCGRCRDRREELAHESDPRRDRR